MINVVVLQKIAAARCDREAIKSVSRGYRRNSIPYHSGAPFRLRSPCVAFASQLALRHTHTVFAQGPSRAPCRYSLCILITPPGTSILSSSTIGISADNRQRVGHKKCSLPLYLLPLPEPFPRGSIGGGHEICLSKTLGCSITPASAFASLVAPAEHRQHHLHHPHQRLPRTRMMQVMLGM